MIRNQKYYRSLSKSLLVCPLSIANVICALVKFGLDHNLLKKSPLVLRVLTMEVDACQKRCLR